MKRLTYMALAFLLGIVVTMSTGDVAAQVKSLIGQKVTGEYTVVVNGETLSDKGAIIDSKANVPARALSEALGADVKVEGKTIYINKEESASSDVVSIDGKYYTKYDLLNKKTTLEKSLEALEKTKTDEENEYKQIKESGKAIDEELWDKRLKSTQNVINIKNEELKQINEALETLK